jgi:hypothetical protein
LSVDEAVAVLVMVDPERELESSVEVYRESETQDQEPHPVELAKHLRNGIESDFPDRCL